MVKRLILITGHAGEGKTTLANKISQVMNINKYALADVLKNITNDLFTLFKVNKPINKSDIRPYYQQIGTEICRKHMGEDIWCKILDEKIKQDPNECCIISDIRFINEHKYFKTHYPNSITIRVFNPTITTIDTHQSESEICFIPYDFMYNISIQH